MTMLKNIMIFFAAIITIVILLYIAGYVDEKINYNINKSVLNVAVQQ